MGRVVDAVDQPRVEPGDARDDVRGTAIGFGSDTTAFDLDAFGVQSDAFDLGAAKVDADAIHVGAAYFAWSGLILPMTRTAGLPPVRVSATTTTSPDCG